MELKRYLAVIWKWSWMIALSVVLAAGFSYIATSRQPGIYQASAQLIVGQSYRSVNPDPQDFQTSTALALTYIQIAKTTPVLRGTLDALGLKMSPEDLRGRFRARLIPNTQLIELLVDDTDPERARTLANELAYQLTLQGPAAQQDVGQREFIQRQADDLQKKIEEAQKTIAELRSSMQVSVGARDVAAKQQQITSLESQISQWQQSYAGMLQLLAPRSPNYLSIVEPAQLPTRPYAPNVMMNVVLAAAIGLALSVGTVVLLEYFDDTLKHVDDVSNVLALPILGTLAKVGNGRLGWRDRLKVLLPKTATPADDETDDMDVVPESVNGSNGAERSFPQLVALSASRSPEAEAYRVLRTNIQYNGVDKPIRSILITSSVAGEGKSFTAANLAVTMAHAGLRTILIDADLRRPSQHRLFNLANDVGLTDCLISQARPSEFYQSTSVENLCVLTSGALPPNPATLLGSQRMRMLMQQLESESEVLIFDGPPCLPVADAAILASLVNGVLLVVDINRTSRKEAQRAKGIVSKVGAQILGVAVNRVALQHDYYYYYEYSPAGQKQRKRTAKSKLELRSAQGK
jgi:capsular exopolysaccharide synthesis family protein